MKYFEHIQDLPPRPRPSDREIEELSAAMKRAVERARPSPSELPAKV